jgi:hypothetical protein
LLGMTRNDEGRDGEREDRGGEKFHVHTSIRKRERCARGEEMSRGGRSAQGQLK